jgi:uncharacterized protein with HEPN domain
MAIGGHYKPPFSSEDFDNILKSVELVAYSDQIIYRFAKLQDCMGAKLFRSILDYQGENTDKPFLDLLNQLERIGVVSVDDWFEFRDLRNEISHNYENNSTTTISVLNAIYDKKPEFFKIINKIHKLTCCS